MLLDTINGTIARRILLNYRFDPATVCRVLPPPFRPKLFRGYGIGGVCMIRFAHLRPRHIPRWLGLSSENAAHRIAVEWEQDGRLCEGVFIPRRDTNSTFNYVLGGRLFPGLFCRARFESRESPSSVSVRIVRPDGATEASFLGHVTASLPQASVFPSVAEAAEFFSLGATGYSATQRPGHFHGMELHSLNWSVVPLAIDDAHSAFFADRERFPIGSAELDCALLMRGVEHEWHSRPDLYVSSNGAALTTSEVAPHRGLPTVPR